jgi:hypothetical protein
MNQVELKNKAITWLAAASKIVKARPHSFTPKEVATAVGGAYTALGGMLGEQVVEELRQQGVNIRYVNNTRPRKFEFLPGTPSARKEIGP